MAAPARGGMTRLCERSVRSLTGCIQGRLSDMATQSFRSDQERICALGAVGLELQMMAHSFALLRQAELAGDEPMAQNAYIDSAHLHVRALVDFLLQPGRGSDIRRTDFTPDWTPEPLEAVTRLDANNRLLHKYLAHLTWERVSHDAPVLNYPNIATDVIDVADAWSDHLASANQPMWKVFRPHVFLARQTLNGE